MDQTIGYSTVFGRFDGKGLPASLNNLVFFGAPIFDGDGGGELTFKGGEIQKVDGNGAWILWGVGQDLVILDKKDGRGSLTLKKFRNVTIRGKKDGDGTLIVEKCESFSCREINGSGQTYLRFDGSKDIGLKDGAGNVYFTDQPPSVATKNGAGSIVRE